MTAPRPLSYPPACWLYVDGRRFADGQPGEADSTPVALSGLAVTWGRSTTIDQPSPATLNFDVLDMQGGQKYLDVLRMGAPVAVVASATIYPDPTVSIVADPGFEALPIGPLPAARALLNNARAAVESTMVHSGVRAVRVEPVNPFTGVTVILPPAPFSAATDAWAAIPRTSPGQSWRYGLNVALPGYIGWTAVADVRPVYFTSPSADVAPVLGTGRAPYTASTVAGWRKYLGTDVPPADVWVGVALTIFPVTPAWDEINPALHWDDIPATIAWDDVGAAYLDDVTVLAPAAGAQRQGAVFAGRITDLAAEWDPETGGTLVRCIAQDDLAELGNYFTGTVPRAAETLAARFTAWATGFVNGFGQPLTWIIDPAVAGLQVTYRDVDSQPRARLVQELAQSVAGALWLATTIGTGPYLYLEDLNSRPALLKLSLVGGVIVIVPGSAMAAKGITLSACDVLLDPVSWVQDSSDSATRVVVTYQAINPVDPTKPIATDITAINSDLELRSGRRRVAIPSQLTSAVDAQTVADSVLGRMSAEGWRINGLTWSADMADAIDARQLSAVMAILDGTTRLGLPIMLTDLPSWSPVSSTVNVPLFLEGGRLSNIEGGWELQLITSSAAGQGSANVRWNDVDAAWAWDQFDPAISWNDLRGVGL